jgi:type II secretory pathway component PulF
MPLFSYVAQDSGNNIKRGTLDDSGRDAVAARLLKSGLRPMEIRRATEGKTNFSLKRFRRERVSRQDVDFFTKQVSLLLGAGLSLDKALRTIKRYSHNTAFSEFVGDVERKLKEGKSFSEA